MIQKVRYRGYEMFPLEATWAFFLDLCGIRWEYEPDKFKVRGRLYWPDFYLPDLDIYLEVKRKAQEPQEFDSFWDSATLSEELLKPWWFGNDVKPLIIVFGDPVNIVKCDTSIYGWAPFKDFCQEIDALCHHLVTNDDAAWSARAHRWTWGEEPIVPKGITIFKGKYRDPIERAAATVPFELPPHPNTKVEFMDEEPDSLFEPEPRSAAMTIPFEPTPWERMEAAYKQALYFCSLSKFGPAGLPPR